MHKPDFDSDFDVGTSPHGLIAASKLPQEEARQKGESLFLADGVNRSATGSHAQRSEHGEQAVPELFRLPSVRSACRRIKAAAAKAMRGAGLHTLRMDDAEFLHVVAAIEHDRNKTRKAISKGLAVYADMEATDSLWEKLQQLRAYRMRGAR